MRVGGRGAQRLGDTEHIRKHVVEPEPGGSAAEEEKILGEAPPDFPAVSLDRLAVRGLHTEIFEPYPDVESVVTTVLTEEEGKTRITVTASYPSMAVRDMVNTTGMARGAAISYDRLEDLVLELQRV